MTAVEWHDAQLKELDYKLQTGLINLTQCKVLMDEAKSQAKKMEKEQIIDFADSYGTYLLVGGTMSAATYNQTFKTRSMTPQKKAIQLVERYDDAIPYLESKSKAKQCALIAVDEIQNTKGIYVNDVEYDYWEKVKHEIINL